jgi:hypothetical protein
VSSLKGQSFLNRHGAVDPHAEESAGDIAVSALEEHLAQSSLGALRDSGRDRVRVLRREVVERLIQDAAEVHVQHVLDAERARLEDEVRGAALEAAQKFEITRNQLIKVAERLRATRHANLELQSEVEALKALLSRVERERTAEQERHQRLLAEIAREVNEDADTAPSPASPPATPVEARPIETQPTPWLDPTPVDPARRERQVRARRKLRRTLIALLAENAAFKKNAEAKRSRRKPIRLREAIEARTAPPHVPVRMAAAAIASPPNPLDVMRATIAGSEMPKALRDSFEEIVTRAVEASLIKAGLSTLEGSFDRVEGNVLGRIDVLETEVRAAIRNLSIPGPQAPPPAASNMAPAAPHSPAGAGALLRKPTRDPAKRSVLMTLFQDNLALKKARPRPPAPPRARA